jgi:hypothetical protein
MPPRIATPPTGDPDRLKALISERPSIVEDRLRVLDVDLGAGTAGMIDLVCLDRAGALALLGVARGDTDRALLELLDQRVWAADQIDLLRRLYSGSGLVADRPIRCILVAPSFSLPFLRRLSILSVPVTPLVARVVPAGAKGIFFEPVGSILGLDDEPPRMRDRRDPGRAPVAAFDSPADRGDAQERRRDGRSAPRDDEDRAVAVEDHPVAVAEIVTEAGEEGPILGADGRPDPLFQEQQGQEGLEPDPFETLTAEELAEFERFDTHRRRRDRSPA